LPKKRISPLFDWSYYQRRKHCWTQNIGTHGRHCLQFEGDRNHVTAFTIPKIVSGSTAEIGIYEMLGSGLREVSNPSEILISHKDEDSGTAIASTLEGDHMIEIQSSALQFMEHHSAAPTGYNAKD
jgi:DNA repair protein RadA/Sms